MRRIAGARTALVLALLSLAVAAHAQPRPGITAPDLNGGPWINSRPLTVPELRGRVVLVEFWTYG